MNASSSLLVKACANVIAIVPGFFGAVPTAQEASPAVYNISMDHRFTATYVLYLYFYLYAKFTFVGRQIKIS